MLDSDNLISFLKPIVGIWKDDLIENIQAHIAVAHHGILPRGAVLDLAISELIGLTLKSERPAQRCERIVGERLDVLLRIESVIDRAAVDRQILALDLLLVQAAFVAALERFVKAGRGDIVILARGRLHGGVIGARLLDEESRRAGIVVKWGPWRVRYPARGHGFGASWVRNLRTSSKSAASKHRFWAACSWQRAIATSGSDWGYARLAPFESRRLIPLYAGKLQIRNEIDTAHARSLAIDTSKTAILVEFPDHIRKVTAELTAPALISRRVREAFAASYNPIEIAVPIHDDPLVGRRAFLARIRFSSGSPLHLAISR